MFTIELSLPLSHKRLHFRTYVWFFKVIQVIEKTLDTIQYISSELTVTVIDYNTSKVA